MGFVLTIVYLIVSMAVLFSMAALLFQGEETVTNRVYLVCQGMVLLWCLSQVLQLTSHCKWQLIVSYTIGNLGICFIDSCWYFFSRLYSNKPLKGVHFFLPFFLSLFHYGMFLTNSLHHLYYVSFSEEEIIHGPFFYTNVFTTYILVILGSVTIYRHMKPTQIKAKLLIAASVLIPVILNALYLVGLIKASFDVTPLGFAISVVFVMLATSKYQFINLRRELAITNEKLLLEKERNRIAQEVHDTVGHTLTMLQSYMKLAQVSAEKSDYAQVEEYLGEGRALSAKGLKELRESINMLRGESECEPVTQTLLQLARQVKEIPVEVTIKGTDDSRYSHLSRPIYETVRESITNTLKYANASKMDIIVRFKEDCLELMVGDDGKGCQKITENNGIRGIRERIEVLGGTVRFSTNPGEGFYTHVRIPVK